MRYVYNKYIKQQKHSVKFFKIFKSETIKKVMYIYIENIKREFNYFTSNNPKYSILLLHLFIVIIILPFFK